MTRLAPVRDSEICILGGGPAGSVIAWRLAQLGHDVMLVHHDVATPRFHAESVAASILPILDSLGLGGLATAATFHRDERSLVLWSSDDDLPRLADGAANLVIDRRRFDELLRDAARRVGASVIPARARAVQRSPAGGWSVGLTTPDGSASTRTRFLVDARGKRRGSALAGGEEGPRTAAIIGAWAAGEQPQAVTRIEAGRHEWLWGTPLPDSRYAVAVFLDPGRIAGMPRQRRIELYRRILARSRLFNEIARGRMLEPIHIRDATPRLVGDLIGADFIRVGEAAFSIDPLSSQGVQAAVLSAIQGSAAVHTLLAEPSDPGPSCQFYRDRQLSAAARSRVNAARYYGALAEKPASGFWKRRAPTAELPPAEATPTIRTGVGPGSRVCVSAELRVVDVPVLSGPVIRRAPSLSHPGLARPVCYFGDVPLVPLIEDAKGEPDADRILRRWARRVPLRVARDIMGWMCAVGLLVPQGTVE